MTVYDVDVEMYVTEFDHFTVEAGDNQEAEHMAKEYIREEYPDYSEVEIVRIQEVA